MNCPETFITGINMYLLLLKCLTTSVAGLHCVQVHTYFYQCVCIRLCAKKRNSSRSGRWMSWPEVCRPHLPFISLLYLWRRLFFYPVLIFQKLDMHRSVYKIQCICIGMKTRSGRAPCLVWPISLTSWSRSHASAVHSTLTSTSYWLTATVIKLLLWLANWLSYCFVFWTSL